MASGTAQELRDLVAAYDRCWREGRIDDLRGFLHPDVVFTGPNFERLVAGLDACVQSYRTFLGQATVHDFTASDHAVDVADGSAVVTYRWTIDYQIGADRTVESGRDLLVLVRRAGRWLIAWRTQRPDQR